METRSFFRWMPTAIVLWAFGGLFAFAAVVSAFQAAHGSAQAMIGNIQQTTVFFWRGAIADALVATCCIFGWHLMRRRLPTTLALGAIVVMVATFIVAHRALIYLFRGAGFEYWCDLVLEVPFLLYALIYAYRECKKVAA